MINKNQYEKSVLTLKKNIPSFVRSVYNEFSICLDELSTELMAAAQNGNPYSVNKMCKGLIMCPDFTTFYHKIFDNALTLAKFKDISFKTAIRDDSNSLTKDEEFYSVNGPDIFAPLARIRLAYTPFSYKIIDSSSCKIPLEYEICDPEMVEFNAKEDTTASESNFSKYKFESGSAYSFDGMNGTRTVLDDLKSELIIDIKGIFDAFYKSLVRHIELPNRDGEDQENDTQFVERLVEVSTIAKDPKVSVELIDKISDELYSSAVVTYFVFASKLVGAKNDIYQWMYTSFVKDSVSSFDETNYPTSAPVTMASGHGVTGAPSNVCDAATAASDGINPGNTVLNTHGDINNKLNRILIYRNIRMQYSVWASVINAVLNAKLWCHDKEGFVKNLKDTSPYYSFKYNSLDYNIFRLETRMLCAYIKAKYRTYNLNQQIDYNSSVPYESTKNISYAVDRIKDEEAAGLVKQAIAGKNIEDTLIRCEADCYNVLAIGSMAVNKLSKFVLNGAYLLLMSRMVSNLDKAKNTIEPTTGRPMKDLFAEIFYNVLDNLKTEYDELSRYLPLDTEKTIYKSSMCRITEKLLDVLLDIGKYYTPINQDCWKDHFDKCHPELKNGFYINSESLVSESLTKLASCITGDRDSFIMHCCTETFSIPLFSDITMFDHEIKNKFPVCGMDECCCSDDIARINNSNNQELFPKNRMIIEGIEKMNFNSHRAFASLESVNEAIDDLQLYADLAAEGADAMASNSVYSNLGSICGGITSLEITNESTTDQDKINVDENTSKILDAANTDADGNLIAAGTNDTLDVANLTHHSVESAHAMVTNETKDMLFNAAAERFNKVFNSVILGLN